MYISQLTCGRCSALPTTTCFALPAGILLSKGPLLQGRCTKRVPLLEAG